MATSDGRFVLAYNGELYNFKTLRQKLQSDGVAFRTSGDTEVILQALARWNSDAMNHFEGMFALALWDSLRRRLLLVRDRLGIKPLFYAESAGRIAFASELPPLLELPWISRRPDPFGVAGYLAHYQPAFDSQTVFSGIRSLEPGCFLTADSDGIRLQRYWQLPITPTAEKEAKWNDARIETAAGELAQLTGSAVRSHMISDVPIGAFLSGGLDSSIVIMLMADYSQERVRAYSVGFDESGYHEFDYSVPLVEKLGLQHDLIRFDPRDYLGLMEEQIRHRRAPLSTPNEIPLLALSRRLAQEIKVVLSGEGADELLGGYAPLLRSPHDLMTARTLRENPTAIAPETRNAIRKALQRQYGRSGFHDPVDHWTCVYSWLSAGDRKTILNRDFVTPELDDQLTQSWRDRFDQMQNLSIYDQYLYLLETEHLRGLLTRLDAQTMAASVEGRVPFCDHKLVEFVWKLPFEYKLRWKSVPPNASTDETALSPALTSLDIAERFDTAKFILKEAFRARLPEPIVNRRKQAFPVPLETILTPEALKPMWERLASSASVRECINVAALPEWAQRTMASGTDGIKVWMALNLGLWLEGMDS